MTATAAALKPRKAPVQSRSTATIDALHVAAIQVLTREGLIRCTTTRVAERAGMSVGSLYQYYPNRDALLAAVLKKHLTGVAAAVEEACRINRDKSVAEMASGLVAALLAAKLRNPKESKALYAVAGERGGPALVVDTHKRMVASIAAMLESAPDAVFDDPETTASVAFSALMGPMRALLEGHTPPALEARFEDQLVRLLAAYLQTHSVRPAARTR